MIVIFKVLTRFPGLQRPASHDLFPSVTLWDGLCIRHSTTGESLSVDELALHYHLIKCKGLRSRIEELMSLNAPSCLHKIGLGISPLSPHSIQQIISFRASGPLFYFLTDLIVLRSPSLDYKHLYFRIISSITFISQRLVTA